MHVLNPTSEMQKRLAGKNIKETKERERVILISRSFFACGKIKFDKNSLFGIINVKGRFLTPLK